MQFHLNGFRPGDPDIAAPAQPHANIEPSASVASEVDVLIIGCGPAGLTLAAQLAAFPNIKTRIVERKPGPLLVGQADGVACRSVEMFNAFGFAERMLKEAYWVNETTFWKPDESAPNSITRSARIQDTEDGLSEFPHLILNQARVHDFYLELMRNSSSQLEPLYWRRFLSLDVASTRTNDPRTRPVRVTLERLDPGYEGQLETINASYVVGCDGAHSRVRESIGLTLHGDSANQAWGVMDVLAVTDFPDIRMKTLIQSANQGSIVIIPREGGYMVRIYVELEKLAANERASARDISSDDLIATVNRIFHPYTLEVKEIVWWSVYEIGQRLCDKFDDIPTQVTDTLCPRVFIAGDACHTHSPKAGQGMNVSMRDTFNLGWKLASVVLGRCTPELLHSYSAERHAVAKVLIDFDQEWSKMISAPPKTIQLASNEGIDPAEFQAYFVRHARYTAGTAIQYRASLIVGEPRHQQLATGFDIGTRFHSAPVIRLADAKPMQLGHTVKADGRWRLFLFGDAQDPIATNSCMRGLCDFLAGTADSIVRKFARAGEDIDAVFDIRAIFQQSHHALPIEAMPSLLLPRKGRYGLLDYEKVFCANQSPDHDIFAMRSVDREHGCIVIVRPDQHVAQVLPLNGFSELSAFFDRFMIVASA